MADIFGKNGYIRGKVLVEGEEDEPLIPVEDTDKILIEEKEGEIDITKFEDNIVFSEGVEGVIPVEIESDSIFVEGDDDNIYSKDLFDNEIMQESFDMTLEQRLKEWAQGNDYESIQINRDESDRIISSSVKWPDGSKGFLTMTDFNAEFGCYDGYRITHEDSGKTVVQAAMVRNTLGSVIYKPELIVI